MPDGQYRPGLERRSGRSGSDLAEERFEAVFGAEGDGTFIPAALDVPAVVGRVVARG